MNQEKIGKFISKLRKEKNMTQNELATKLGITDRAVSKWENGRGMPDLSLIKPLCDVLDISVSELLCGEKINKKEYQLKLEETILNTIDYSSKKIKKTTKIFKMIIITIISILLLLLLMFFIDVRRMNQNKKVIFSSWGYDYTPPINIEEPQIYNSIKEYLINKNDIKSNNSKNTKIFISMEVSLLEEKNKDEIYNVYAWVKKANYYLENNELKEDSSYSSPYKFTIKKNNNNYYVIDYKTPRDGKYYKDDMNNIFPKSVRNKMNNIYNDGTNIKLDLEIKEQVRLYFHK